MWIGFDLRHGTTFCFLVSTIIVANMLIFFTPVVERDDKARFAGQPAE